jgi:MFS family permease
VACFSPFCGFLADRCGNRLVLRLQCVVLMAAPLVALALAGLDGPEALGRRWYWVVFLLLGMSPVTMRTINNYTLELVGPELHPLYLSTMRVCFLIPFLFSPLAGGVLDLFADRPYTGACWLFGTVSGLIALAGLLTWRMAEPRRTAAPLFLECDETEFPPAP